MKAHVRTALVQALPSLSRARESIGSPATSDNEGEQGKVVRPASRLPISEAADLADDSLPVREPCAIRLPGALNEEERPETLRLAP